jgi:hypothetical protein
LGVVGRGVVWAAVCSRRCWDGKWGEAQRKVKISLIFLQIPVIFLKIPLIFVEISLIFGVFSAHWLSFSCAAGGFGVRSGGVRAAPLLCSGYAAAVFGVRSGGVLTEAFRSFVACVEGCEI